MIIRPYEPADRVAIRQICCETADAGQPVEGFCSDRELIADLVTRYYTDFDSGYIWVVEHDREVLGYLTGCLDAARQQRLTAWRVGLPALVRALNRRETWRLIVAGWRSRPRTHAYLTDYPANLHVNLLPAARGQAAGRRLVERFVDQARRASVTGVHASTRADNVGACRFFERLGFIVTARWPMTLPRAGRWWLTETVVYAKRI